MGLWGAIKSVGRSVWDGIKGAGSAVWHIFGGSFSILTNGLKNFFSHLALLWEVPGLYLFGWMPEKKLRLRVIILSDKDGMPTASRDRVESAVTIAKTVLKHQLNVVIQGVNGEIVRELVSPSPSYVLDPPCSETSKHFGRIFSRAGAWYRNHVARTPGGTFVGYGTPITVFVVRDVIGKKGCAYSAWAENYAYIDPDALPPRWVPSGDVDDVRPFTDVEHSTLPHEIGHCCDLIKHRKPKRNLMHSSQTTRTGTDLTKWQKAVARTSTHVTTL